MTGTADCCARTASGHSGDEPTILMKSRLRTESSWQARQSFFQILSDGQTAGRPNVRFGSKADICTAPAHVRFTPNSDIDCVFRHVRFTPKSGHVQCNSRCPLWATCGHWSQPYPTGAEAIVVGL